MDLEGTGRKETKAVFITKASEIKNITTDVAATAAGARGAISIWLDNDNHFRCEAMRYLVSVDTQIYSDVNKVEAWAKEWLSKINDIKSPVNGK